MKASNPIPEFIFFRKPRNHFRGFGHNDRFYHQSIAATLITRAKKSMNDHCHIAPLQLSSGGHFTVR